MPELSSRVVDEVRRRLSAAGMSGRTLATLAGMPQRTLSDKLALRAPFTLDDVERVAAVLDVDPAELLGDVDDEGLTPEPFPESWAVRSGDWCPDDYGLLPDGTPDLGTSEG